MRLKRKVKVKLERPVPDEITKGGGEWGAPRRGGRPHKGLDFMARWGHKVYACDDGNIVFSVMIERVAGRKGSYGNTVVIDHTPMAKENQRHIYTVYAHLHTISGSKDKKVKAGDTIGTSGNTGTSQWYYWKEHEEYESETKRGYHLHFEVIDTKDSKAVMNWSNKNKLPSGHRQDPSDYFGKTIKIEYPLSESEMRKVRSCIGVYPKIDLKRGRWEADVFIGRKKVGRIDKFKKQLKLRLTGKELDELLKNPVRPPRGASGKGGFGIEIN